MGDVSGQSIFDAAEWYDLGINWQARIDREIPVLCEVLGPPGKLGVLDAACGPGRQLVAMAERGYRMTGLDASADMLAVAGEHLAEAGAEASLVQAEFVDAARAGGPFDGVYCLGNSLAATGSADAARRSLAALVEVLRPEGRLFVQVLNFDKLRGARPCVRGPRVRTHKGTEYVSTRVYAFVGEVVEVTNVTMWQEGGAWQQFASCGTLYPIRRSELESWCNYSRIAIDEMRGGYEDEPFAVDESNDLILVGTRKA